MASGYPAALDSFATSHVNGETIAPATDNDQADAINKIEAELGTDPSGSFATVTARLNARLTCRKTADQSFASTTPANVTDLLLPVGTTGLDYTFRFVVPWSTTTSGNGIGFAVTVPALGTGGYVSYLVEIVRIQETAAGTAPTATNMLQVGPGISSGDAVTSDTSIQNSITVARIEGVLSNPSATGNVQLQCRGETTSAVVVKKGSYGELYIN
jgi:hypothetical protein